VTQVGLCVLLDANVIIEAHACGAWASLHRRVALVVPSTVLDEATHYVAPDTGMRVEIHVKQAVQAGQISEVSATAEQLARLLDHFDRVFIERMDPGETEALALLLAGELEDCMFCSSDGPAIRALNLLSMPDRGISLEALLRKAGLVRRLARPFDDRFFREMQARGAQEFVRGEGLRRATSPPKSTERKPRRQGKSARKT
jgi:hypothetical protein